MPSRGKAYWEGISNAVKSLEAIFVLTYRFDVSVVDTSVLWPVSEISIVRVVLNAREDKEKEDGEAHSSGGEHAHERDVLQGTGKGHDNAHNGRDHRLSRR